MHTFLKRSLAFVLVMNLFLLTGCSKYSLKGTVTDKATGLPIEGVDISIKAGAIERTGKTNNKGKYSVSKDKKVPGLLTASKDGFTSFEKDQILEEKDFSFWLRPTAEETAKRIIGLERQAALLANEQRDLEKERGGLENTQKQASDGKLNKKDSDRLAEIKTRLAQIPDQYRGAYQTIYATYLHPNYQAAFSLDDFIRQEQAYETANALITTDPFDVRSSQNLTSWRDDRQNKVYETTQKVVIEVTTKAGDQEAKLSREFYFGLFTDYWHFFWVNR
ncbi:MAG: carboxypeptidase-like regulatory domain-containing protein [bacterium]